MPDRATAERREHESLEEWVARIEAEQDQGQPVARPSQMRARPPFDVVPWWDQEPEELWEP